MNVKEVGCWIIQYVDRERPWLGTRQSPWKAHTMQPYMDRMRCSTCGLIVELSGEVVSQVTPKLEAERAPTEREQAAYDLAHPTT